MKSKKASQEVVCAMGPKQGKFAIQKMRVKDRGQNSTVGGEDRMLNDLRSCKSSNSILLEIKQLVNIY